MLGVCTLHAQKRMDEAQKHTNMILIDPRTVDVLPESPKPLTPPGCLTDGWGQPRPWLVDARVLTDAQARTLLRMGTPIAFADFYP